MRLTPLGKLLVFLIGLGLVGTVVYRFVPPDKLPKMPWNRSASPAPAPPPFSTSTPTSTPPPAPKPLTSAAGDWIDVPAGLFRSGANGAEVDVPAFRIQRAEVTNRQYESFLRACPPGTACGPRESPSYWDDASYLETHLDDPVVFVSWGDANAYCKWENGRLPSVLEWEKAARGTDGREFPTGTALSPSDVNILGADRHDEKNRAAKQIPTWAVNDPRYARDRSPYGVLGMSGNVSEWTSSASEDEPDLRLAAGGSWDSWEFSDGRAYFRIPKNPSDRSSSLGWRCASAR